MNVWILTSEHNDYDQHGEYFLEVFKDKPTIEQLAVSLNMEINEFTSETLSHILRGGGRRDKNFHDFYNWYYLRETEAK